RTLQSRLATEASPNGEFQAGLWRLVAGDTDSARRHFQRALELDELTPRAPEALNDFLRGFADDERIVVWDGEHIHQAAAPSGIPGWETFADCCHYTPAAADRTLNGLFDRTRQALHLEPCTLGSSSSADISLPWLFLQRGVDPDGAGETWRDWSLGI